MVYLPDEGETPGCRRRRRVPEHGHVASLSTRKRFPRTAAAAQAAGKPWVLDPVGIGIGSLRTKLLSELKQHKPAIVRGNASEIIALAGLWGLEGDGRRSVRAPAASTPPIRWRLHVRRPSRWLATRKAPLSSPASPTWSPTGIRSSSAYGGSAAYGQGHRLRLLSGRRACRIRLRKPIRSRPLLPR